MSFLLNTVSPEKAEGEIKAVYDTMIENIGIVPKPIEMSSVSPFFFKSFTDSIGYFSSHSNLDFTLLAMIRMLSAESCANGFCIEFNGAMLKKQGMTNDEIAETINDPSKAPLPEKDKALLLLVLKAVKIPEEVTQEEVDALYSFGWTDRDI